MLIGKTQQNDGILDRIHTFPTYGRDKKDAQRHLEPDAPIVSSRSLFWACFVKKQFWGGGPYFRIL